MLAKSVALLIGAGVSCSVIAACAAGSSGGSPTLAPGTYAAESGSGTLPGARTADCGTVPYYEANAQGLAQLAGRSGISAQANPVDALRAVLTHGSEPFWGGRGGSGVVGVGYPASGWKQISATKGHATFQAPLNSGTAKLTLTRIASHWLVSHLEKDC